MKPLLLSWVLLIPKLAFCQFAPSAIQNTAVPLQGQFNITSATIRGVLTVGQINASTITFSTATFSAFSGNGANLTNLNASQLLAGTASSSVITGNYYGITGVGNLSTGTWQAGIIAPKYGGTGANLITASTGSLPYFIGSGTMSFILPGISGQLLQTMNTTGPPVWTSTPSFNGGNITGIPLVNLSSGNLPTNILINDASISTVSASKVNGNISGKATNITGLLALSQLATGTFVTTQVASSITATGVTPGIYGGGSYIMQETIGSDGRAYTATQVPLTVSPSSITVGPLPAGVTIGAGQITAGTVPGTIGFGYGFNSSTAVFTSSVTVGYISGNGAGLTNVNIAGVIPSSVAYQTQSNTFTSSQTIIGSGGLGVTYGVSAGSITVISTMTAGYISAGKISASTGVFTSSVTALAFFGNGSNLTGINATGGNQNTFNSSVTVNNSSITLNGPNGYITSQSSITAGLFVGSGAGLTNLPNSLSGGVANNLVYWTGATSVSTSSINQDSPTSVTVASSVTITGAGLSITGSSLTLSGNFLRNTSSITGSYDINLGSGSSTTANFATIAGGYNNTNNSSYGFIGAGTGNSIGGGYSFIGAGISNSAQGTDSLILGGSSNSITSNAGAGAVIAGGTFNTINRGGAVIGGGSQNSAGPGTTGVYSIIPGGYGNTASGNYSIAFGQFNNASGLSSVAVGSGAIVSGQGSMYLADSSATAVSANFVANSSDTFYARFRGGFNFYSTTGTVFNSSVTATSFYGNGSNLTGISGSLSGGTTNKIPYWTSATTLGNSPLNEDSAGSLTTTSSFTISNSTGLLVTSTITAGAFIGNGAGLTGVIATVLPSSVAYQNQTNTFTSSQTITSSSGLGLPNGPLNLGGNLVVQNSNTNMFYGYQSGLSNSGTNNASFGYESGYSNTSGLQNSFFGASAGYENINGYNNTAVGLQALYSNSSGNSNTVIGSQALSYDLFSYNTAVGFEAGSDYGNSSGQNINSYQSLYLGALSQPLASGDFNEIVLGYNATGYGSNTATLGNSLIVQTYLQGQVVAPNVVVTSSETIPSGLFSVGGSTFSIGGGTISIQGQVIVTSTFSNNYAPFTVNSFTSNDVGSHGTQLYLRRAATNHFNGLGFGGAIAYDVDFYQEPLSDTLNLGSYPGSGAATKMMSWVPSTGYVGIGSSVPISQLTIAGNDPGGIAQLTMSTVTNPTVSQVFGIGVEATNGALFTGSINGDVLMYAPLNKKIAISGTGTNVVFLATGSYVGIGGQMNPAQALDVTGTIRQSNAKSCTTGVQTNSSGDFSACVASDQSLKTNVQPLAITSSTVDSLQPVLYNWIDTQARDAQQHAGFVAQQVQAVMPQAVVPAGVNLLGLDSNALIAILTQEIQGLRLRVAALEAQAVIQSSGTFSPVSAP